MFMIIDINICEVNEINLTENKYKMEFVKCAFVKCEHFFKEKNAI